MSNLMLDVDQAGELKAAFRRHDYTNGEIKTLSEGDLLGRVRLVVQGSAIIAPKAMSASRLQQLTCGVPVPGNNEVKGTFFSNKKLVGYRDPDIDALLGKQAPAASERCVAAYNLAQSMTFMEMVADRLGMPGKSEAELGSALIAHGMDIAPGQVEFILAHTTAKWNPFGLLMDGWANFFFVAVNGQPVVLRVHWNGDGARWHVCADRFDYAHRSIAKHRVFLGNSLTL